MASRECLLHADILLIQSAALGLYQVFQSIRFLFRWDRRLSYCGAYNGPGAFSWKDRFGTSEEFQ